MRVRKWSLFVIVSLAFLQVAQAQDHWVTTWTAAPQIQRAPAGGAAAAAPPLTSFNDQTIRMIARASIGGRRARVMLTNAFGNKALKIGSAHVAMRSKESEIVAGSDRALMFNGKPSVSIPQGAQIVSDPFDLEIPQLGELAISVYVPEDSGQITTHATGLHTTYIAKGNVAAERTLAVPEINATMTRSYYFLSAVDVMAPPEVGALVAFGDSITDGATSTNDTDRSWPAILAGRILTSQGVPKVAVLNQGISGNRLLIDGAGVSALARFERDVLGMSGVRWLAIMEGINDIGGTTGPPRGNAPPATPVTADELITVIKQMIDRAHAHNIRVIGATLTPYEGAGYYSEKGEEIRQAVNRWIRTSGAFDAVVDFDKVTQDSSNAKTFKPTFNNTDHLHPNDAGYKAMADSIDLKIFTGKK